MKIRIQFDRLLPLLALLVCPLFATSFLTAADPRNLIEDGSFEQPTQPDQFGHVFKAWGGWKYEGDCAFAVGHVAHSGKTSGLLFGASQPKIRLAQTLKALAPGRYKITAFIRGLDIGEGQWHATTEFAFGDKYMGLKKNGTFGWTPLTYVADVKEKNDFAVSFGLMAPGHFWIDDVSAVAVGDDVAPTPEPVLGKEESPIAPPGELGENPVRCRECGYKNNPVWGKCYACGEELLGLAIVKGPAVKVLASFEDSNPFDAGTIVTEHATDGTHALKLGKGYAGIGGALDWSGYDYLKIDLYTDSDKPLPLYLEFRDQQTRDYWTRVNYTTIVAPGKSTLVIPLAQLYVGEKARPGRNLILSAITRMVLSLGDSPTAPLFLDNMRLERDTDTQQKVFDGLYAFSCGPKSGPLMPGFIRVDPTTVYSKGRGFGLKDAQIWRAVDALQPEPLYQNCLCIEKGGLAVDLPNGRYHVFVNIDNPSFFWGEYQSYRQRAILAQGTPVVQESMTFDSLKKKYFRHWDTEDVPRDDTFDKYQTTYFQEKEFDVDVTNGQLQLDFHGEAWACSVSAVVIYPEAKAAQGKAFLEYAVQKRRFFFDNYFHRVLHKASGDPLAPSRTDLQRGYVVFSRDYMENIYDNDTPKKGETGQPIKGAAFAGQYEPMTVNLSPFIDLGKTTATISDLTGPGTIAAHDIAVGYVSYRITRVTSDGSVYTITPRMVIPRATVAVDKGITRRFWLTVHPPADTKPGLYKGNVTITPEHGQPSKVAVEFEVYSGTLDPLDIPAGPFSHEIHIPWDGNDPATQAWDHSMEEAGLRRLHDYGFTTFTGMPLVRYLGFKDGKPQFDFSVGDEQMKLARKCGFTMPVVTYIGLPGLDIYWKDEAAMKAAGFTDYSKFIKAIFSEIQTHADAANWLPVYWNLADEPIGDDVTRSAENAEPYHAAFGKGPPWFTGATSFDSGKADDPHYRMAKALTAPALNGHDEASVRMLQAAGGGWGFYNGGNRWTYGVYMYKAAKQFDMKFRISWHWNATAGDPYYALDCREDDYAWCNASPEGELVPSVEFERDMRGGIDDYRMILTLARLAREKHDAPAQTLIDDRLSKFKLGQREHDELFPASDWQEFRRTMAEAITRLRAGN